MVGQRDQQHRRRRLRGRAAAAGRDDHQGPAARLGRHCRDLPALDGALPPGRRAGRPLRPGHAHVALPGGAGRRGSSGGDPHRLPDRGHRGPRRGRPAPWLCRGRLQQRRAVGAPRPGPARTPAQGQRQPGGQPDRGRVVPRAAGRQPAVRRGRRAALRAGRRLVRGLGRAAGPIAQNRIVRNRSFRNRSFRNRPTPGDPHPDHRRVALASRPPPAARGRRPARRVQLRQPDGPGHPGPAGHPDAAPRHQGLRVPAGGDRCRQRGRRAGEPAADPKAGPAALADHRGGDRSPPPSSASGWRRTRPWPR